MKRQYQETMETTNLIVSPMSKRQRPEDTDLGSPWDILSEPSSTNSSPGITPKLSVDTTFKIPDEEGMDKLLETKIDVSPGTKEIQSAGVIGTTTDRIPTPFPKVLIGRGMRQRKDHTVTIHDSMWHRCPPPKKNNTTSTVVFAVLGIALLVFCFVFLYKTQPKNERGPPGIMELPTTPTPLPAPISTEMGVDASLPVWLEKSENVSCRRHRLRGGHINTDCVFRSKPTQMALQPDLLRMK